MVDAACDLHLTRFYAAELVKALEYMHSQVRLCRGYCRLSIVSPDRRGRWSATLTPRFTSAARHPPRHQTRQPAPEVCFQLERVHT